MTNVLAQKITDLRLQLASQDPQILAVHTLARFQPLENDQGELILPVWESEISIHTPDFDMHSRASRQPLTPDLQALLLYHLITSDGSPETGKWISFADLPGGRFYNAAFQGYTGSVIASSFGQDDIALSDACLKIGGEQIGFADRSYRFAPLPRVPLLVAWWQGDEDFPDSAQILFDSSASHHLPVDVCAVLGSMLVKKILRSREKDHQ